MNKKWTYGVTTVPERKEETLARTLRSLATAGFDQPHLFVDGQGELDRTGWLTWLVRNNLSISNLTIREPRIKVFGNWIMALIELWIRDPGAERFAIFQDDLVCVKNLREYLDRSYFPDGPLNSKKVPPGYLNLYLSRSNVSFLDGRKGWQLSHQQGRGALALVFSRQGVIELLSSGTIVQKPIDKARGWRAVDGAVVQALGERGYKEYCHSPSLVLHTGTLSTIDKDKLSHGNRKDFPRSEWPDGFDGSLTFPGENFDALELLGKGDGPLR